MMHTVISSCQSGKMHTVELQWLEHFWNHENMFETGEFELMSVNSSTGSKGKIGISFRLSLT